MAHSAEPWVINPAVTVHEGLVLDLSIRSENPAASLWVCSISGEHLGIALDEMLANAALVRAAPTMLRALRSALSALDPGSTEHADIARAISDATTPPAQIVDRITALRSVSQEAQERKDRAEYERLRAKFETAKAAA